MIHNLESVEVYLAALPVKPQDYEARLQYVKDALTKLSNPQDTVPAIHIAGTSGKGSTAYYAANMLQQDGYRVGLAVSPHVNYVSERTQINGSPLPEQEYCRYINEFISVSVEHGFIFSYIEFLDVFAYWLFQKCAVGYMVIEVGMGGRLDPTNVMQREDKVCVITDIGYDHTEILGDTLEAITTEKSGIIYTHNDVVMYEQSSEVVDAVRRVAETNRATLIFVEQRNMPLSALPLYQQRNWQLAKKGVEKRLEVDDQPRLSSDAISISLRAHIPGRFEVFQRDGVTIVLDAAHNPQKISALAQSLEHAYANRNIVQVVAFGENKRSSVKECLETMHHISDTIVATTFTAETYNGRGYVGPGDITDIAKQLDYNFTISEADQLDAVRIAIDIARKTKAVVVVTGSFYLIDGIRLFLLDAK